MRQGSLLKLKVKLVKEEQIRYCEVLLPLAIPKTYSYSIPVQLLEKVQFGVRVEIPLRNKLYSGIVVKIHGDKPEYKTRHILSVLDDEAIITEKQYDFWTWLADYYCALLGEVMSVALPSGLKLASETKVLLNEGVDYLTAELTDQEYLVAEAVSIQNELTIDQIRDVLGIKTVYPVIKELLKKRVLVIKEELKQKFKKKSEDFIRVLVDNVEDALSFTSRSEKQTRALLSYFSLQPKMKHVSKAMIYEMADVDSATIKGLEKKELIELYALEKSRINLSDNGLQSDFGKMSEAQTEAVEKIHVAFENKKTVLLHGVTGSGKTRIYSELIHKVLSEGGQVLYLLPEIALTNQIVSRLEEMIGENMLVYHSKINEHQRVEIWNAAKYTSKLFVGARSSIFLPFDNLRLIIVDEEHDSSYKQQSPNPRYQGRDAAVYLASLYGANVVLGSATPSLESYYNASINKYAYVRMDQRFGEAQLPEVVLVDLKADYKKGLIKEGFSKTLLDAIEDALSRSEQVILFQNRRGYAPVQKCKFCDWVAECANCDVSLTYHQSVNELKCHYCGYKNRISNQCPACGNHELEFIGMGTQKVEEILPKYIEGAKIARFDYDTTRTKAKQEIILSDFEDGLIDILVGTQMVTKGFDFERISLVGILNADSLLSYPDFRASEKSYQLMMQVSGRAGRRDKRGKVIIQTYSTSHPVIQEVDQAREEDFYQRELKERNKFNYPPFTYYMAIWLKHKDLKLVKEGADFYSKILSKKLGKRVIGPVDPSILRIRNHYHQIIYIKSEKKPGIINKIKSFVLDTKRQLLHEAKFKSLSISLDVDPY